ncbi:MAG: hypothetical protein WBP26_02235 [Candidatus Saccharimonadales bacterium]
MFCKTEVETAKTKRFCKLAQKIQPQKSGKEASFNKLFHQPLAKNFLLRGSLGWMPSTGIAAHLCA